MLVTTCLVGCDAISRTKIAVSLRPTDTRESFEVVADIEGVARDMSMRFVLAEHSRGDGFINFTDAGTGQNPDIWLNVSVSSLPVTIEIVEMYIDHRTEKHKKIANSLIQNLEARRFETQILYNSDGIGWQWRLLATISIASIGGLFWTWMQRISFRA